MRIKSLFEHGIRITLRFTQAYAERHVLHLGHIQDHPFLPTASSSFLHRADQVDIPPTTSSAIMHGLPYLQVRHHLHTGDRNSDKGFLDALLKEWESGAVELLTSVSCTLKTWPTS